MKANWKQKIMNFIAWMIGYELIKPTDSIVLERKISNIHNLRIDKVLGSHVPEDIVNQILFNEVHAYFIRNKEKICIIKCESGFGLEPLQPGTTDKVKYTLIMNIVEPSSDGFLPRM